MAEKKVWRIMIDCWLLKGHWQMFDATLIVRQHCFAIIHCTKDKNPAINSVRQIDAYEYERKSYFTL
jgi:hypothetical protein